MSKFKFQLAAEKGFQALIFKVDQEKKTCHLFLLILLNRLYSTYLSGFHFLMINKSPLRIPNR